jgi:hypothetical protein
MSRIPNTVANLQRKLVEMVRISNGTIETQRSKPINCIFILLPMVYDMWGSYKLLMEVLF